MTRAGTAVFPSAARRFAVCLVVTGLMTPGSLAAQSEAVLLLSAGESGSRAVELARERGFPSVPAAALEWVGWRLTREADGYRAALPAGPTLEFRPGAPFVRLDGTWAQLVDAPYEQEEAFYLPLQLFTDVLPDRLPDLYRSDHSRDLQLLDPNLWRPGDGSRAAKPEAADAARSRRGLTRPGDDGVRVVVIDPGHGGVDPGALGRRRTREKDITLALARAIAAELEEDPGLEVHLTRDEDVLVPLWERGEIATRLKGDRYGVFLSIHANFFTRQDVRGLETYFLSEARTEHEARVAALENSAMELERNRPSGPTQGELGAIISELLNLDYQHWSSELATRIQGEIARIHPGPDRGVKQGPLAVLTNAMMPSVLLEIGFITNPEEEAVISDPEFHQEAARGVARAVRSFFRRYPPGAGTPTGER